MSCLRNSLQLNNGRKVNRKMLERSETMFHPDSSGANLISSRVGVGLEMEQRDISNSECQSINMFLLRTGKGGCLFGKGKSTLGSPL